MTTGNLFIENTADELTTSGPKLGFAYHQLNEAKTERIVQFVTQRILWAMVHEMGQAQQDPCLDLHAMSMETAINFLKDHTGVDTVADYTLGPAG